MALGWRARLLVLWRLRFGRWLDRRIPPASPVVLSQRNIFIFPTRIGFAFGVLILLLIIGAINYQSSLVYGVAFLLGSLFLVTILYTFRNLSGLLLSFEGARAGFVGEDVEFVVRVSRPALRDGPLRAFAASHEGVEIGWNNGISQWTEFGDRSWATLRLFTMGLRRGYFSPGRLLVETSYPLGLLRAWTSVDLGAEALVYPKPLFDVPLAVAAGRQEEGALVDPHGSEDFSDIRAYRTGDPTRHILWRSYARGSEIAVKEYASYVEPRLWLDLEQVPGNVEERLSRLTGQALQATRSEREFGLRLGATMISPARGASHLDRVLRELALYGLPKLAADRSRSTGAGLTTIAEAHS